MKIIILASLLFAFSCSTEKTIQVEESTPTESDSKIVNPKDIQACYCEKIYMPVCGSDNHNYPNACEAECYGILKWTEGNCN